MDENLVQKIDAWIGENEDSFVRDLDRLVSIPSISEAGESGYPFGKHCAEVLDEVIRIAEEYGIQINNHEYYCGSALLKGTSADPKRVGLFAHLDVVPLGDGWQYPPLHCTKKDGMLIGRGVGDNKGPAVCALYALRFLKEQGVCLKHDVMAYFGLSEETGMQDIQYFCKTQQIPEVSLVTDTNFPICYGEKGLLRFETETEIDGNLISFLAGSVVNVIPARAEAVIEGISLEEVQKRMGGEERLSFTSEKENVKITATGISKHAAFPEGAVNAVWVLADALIKAELLSGRSLEAVKAVAEMTKDFYGAGCDIVFQDEESGSLTCVGSVVKTNGHRLSVSFDIRYPVTVSGEHVQRQFCHRVEELGFLVVTSEDSSPAYVPLDHPVLSLLCGVCDKVLGKHYEPYTMGGGTYSRHLPFAIGFGPGVPDAPNPFEIGHGQGHQPDECISFEILKKGIAVYIAAIMELDEFL